MINLLRSKETSIFKKGDGVAAQLRITNRGISTKVEQNGVVSAINQSPESITIDAAKVNVNGVLNVIKASITDLYAFVAKIGGFTINATSIFSGTAVTSNSDNAVALSSTDFTRTVSGASRTGLRFAIGSKFGVAGDGTLYANGANVSSISVSDTFELIRSSVSMFKIWVESNKTKLRVGPTTSYIEISSDNVVDIMRSGTSIAQYGDTARIGPSGSSHVNVGSNAIDFYGASGNDKLLSLSVLQQSYGGHGYSPTGNYGAINFPLSGGGVVETKNGESSSSLYLNATGVTQPILTANLGCYDDSNSKYTGVSIDGITRDIDLTGNVTIHGNLCFSPATSIFGSNIIGIYAGTTVATLSNGNWASLASKSTLESKLGSGVTNTNTIIIAQNGDCNAVGNYAFSGAITSDGAARGYVYPAVSGSVRWNWIAIRFSN